MDTTQMRRQPQPIHHDVADADDFYSTRMPSSARRYKIYDKGESPLSTSDDSTMEGGTLIRRRASRRGQVIASNAVTPSMQTSGTGRVHGRRFTMVMLVLGAVAAVVLIMLISALLSWWQGVMDNIHYGNPRTSQLDAVVGHNDSATNQTHFIFLNLHGHVEIIEIPGGDTSRVRIFTGPTLVGAGQDLIPVTGEIRDEDGRHDLIVHIQNQQIVYINDGTTFHQQ
jgi:hypothetical protein